MFVKRIVPAILSCVFLGASIIYAADQNRLPLTSGAKGTPVKTYAVTKPQQEIRGVWVTYMTLDVSGESDRETAFKEKIDAVIEDMTASNLNTMIVQVRPFSDALYPSRYYPWSHILTGNQGQDPGYDPLAYIVQKAHDNGMMVHAWVNPYRISNKSEPSKLSDDHPYVKDPDIGVKVGGNLYFNPASQKAQELITNGVREIVANYDVDGIQFDDYFYPPDSGDFDSADYEAYCHTADDPLPLDAFRKANVNTLIAGVYQAVHEEKEDVLFGISPQGNLSNNEKLYADVVTWCTEEGYIDYICPQVYFSLDNPALTFEDGLQDWLDLKRHQHLSLYVGIPAYKAGTDADEGTWLDNSDILKTEVAITREKQTDGFMLYSYDSLHNEDNHAEIENLIRYLTTSPTQ